MNNNKISISTKNLSLFYAKKQILFNITQSFEKNKITAIIGQSGSGKSSFLKCLNRIAEEDGGKITGEAKLEEDDALKFFSDYSKEELRKKIALVFQTPIAFPVSIEKNITDALRYHFSLNKKEASEKAKQYLQMVNLYEDVKNRLSMPANKLSGGEKQRLAIARAISIEPKVLMLDEPTASLDIKNTLYIEKTLLELKKDYTIILVTHNLGQAERIADNIVCMDDGKITETRACLQSNQSRIAARQDSEKNEAADFSYRVAKRR